MQRWTDSAERELQAYFDTLRERLRDSGADPDEVSDDLRRHIDAELDARRVDVVTAADLAAILDRLGPLAEIEPAHETPPRADAPAPAPAAAAGKRAAAPVGRSATALVVLLGIFTPLTALVLELLTGVCRQVLFNPLPTFWHALLVAVVPLANALTLGALLARSKRFTPSLLVANAVAIGAALYYAILFLPFSPFALLGVIYFGAGLIPLSPITALFAAVYLRRRLRALAPDIRPPVRLWLAIAGVLLIMLLAGLPRIVTMVGLRMAASDATATQQRGLALLRHCGNDEQLLRACYIDPDRSLDYLYGMLVLFGDSPSLSDVQAVYYKVTGTPFNAVRPPRLRGLRSGPWTEFSEFDFDQGGDAVAARVRGLSLAQSRIDADVAPDAATAYTEWVLEFHNSTPRQQEARARIALPPGAVVSRLTLWIDGEEREAAYGGRSQVKAAYKKVVQRRRDPVLVTTAGRDQVLLQCFPVPPRGVMKTKIGITSPLVLTNAACALLALPTFIERNFAIPPETEHAVWIEAPHPMHAPAASADRLASETPRVGTCALRGKLSDALLESRLAIAVERNAAVHTAWASDTFAPHDDTAAAPPVVFARISPIPVTTPTRLVIVLDGSRRMADYATPVTGAMRALPPRTELALMLAADTPELLVPPTAGGDGAFAAATAAIAACRFVGGCDNVPALTRAWELAAARPGGAILWITAAQPLQLTACEELRQKWYRRPDGPPIYVLQVDNGPNRISDELGSIPALSPIPRLLGVRDDLRRQFALWSGTAENWHVDFERTAASSPPTQDAVRATSHLARLWACDAVRRKLATGGATGEADAIELATRYHLVTPVSGAVVLETAAQYADAGLNPISPDAAPAIAPEPATWLLLIVGALMLATRLTFCSLARANTATSSAHGYTSYVGMQPRA